MCSARRPAKCIMRRKAISYRLRRGGSNGDGCGRRAASHWAGQLKKSAAVNERLRSGAPVADDPCHKARVIRFTRATDGCCHHLTPTKQHRGTDVSEPSHTGRSTTGAARTDTSRTVRGDGRGNVQPGTRSASHHVVCDRRHECGNPEWTERAVHLLGMTVCWCGFVARNSTFYRLDAGGHEGRNGRSMAITLLHAVLAIVLAANAVVAFAAIAKIEPAHRE